MDNFLDLQTKIYFGKGQIENLNKEINQYGNKVLFLTGMSSSKE